jgi:hypothetical protein
LAPPVSEDPKQRDSTSLDPVNVSDGVALSEKQFFLLNTPQRCPSEALLKALAGLAGTAVRRDKARSLKE